MSSGFRVGPSMHIQVEYRVSDAEGEAVGADSEHLTAIYGMGQLLPEVEKQLDGMEVGEAKRIKLAARDAYGSRNPDAVLEVERGEFPDDVQPGDFFEVENADRGVLVLRILEVADEAVLVDLNHPLAGQDLEVEMKILDVRPATQAELEHAMAVANEPKDLPESPLISPDALLRGPRRR